MFRAEITPQHLSYYDITRNVDSTLSLFCSQRNDIVRLLIEDPDELFDRLWSSNSLVGIDKKCMYQMGSPFPKKVEDKINNRKDFNLLTRRLFCCPSCNIMRRLYDSERFGPDSTFKLECGRDQGKMFIVKSVPITVLQTKISLNPHKYLDLILREEYNMKKCEPHIDSSKDSTFMGLDSFTTQLLVTWYVDSILSEKRLHHVNKIYNAFVCGNKGYMLEETPDIGNIFMFSKNSPFSETREISEIKHTPYIKSMDGPLVVMKSSTIINILKQLLSTLHLLHQSNFTIGGVDTDSLVFYSERSIYNLDGVNVNCDFTVKLNNLENAGITVKESNNRQIRLYHQSDLADSLIDAVPFKPMIKTASIKSETTKISTTCPSNYCDLDQAYYVYKIGSKLDKKHSLLYLYMQNLGIPLYQSSFDIYCFIIMLMSNFSFYVGVSEDPIIFNIWKSMWIPSEFEDINVKIREFHSNDKISKNEIFTFLLDFSLRCDVNNLLWESIKELNL